MDTTPNTSKFYIVRKFFWRFILFFLLLYIFPYDLGFGFSDQFEEWRLWHTSIFWIGEQILGWDFDYENPLLGWDSKFEVCRYIFIFVFGALLTIIWVLLDYFYLKSSYEKKLIALVQTFLRYQIAITMLHYGLAKVFMQQFGTIDINTLEGTFGDNSPMELMWAFLSYSKTVTIFSGWMETIGALLLFFRKTTLIGATILVIALANVVLWDIGYNVSVTLYAIHLLLLTLVLLTNQFKNLYHFFITGMSTTASIYNAFITNTKYRKIAVVIKLCLIISVGVLFAKDTISAQNDYFSNNYQWFTALHKIEEFTIHGDTIKNANTEKKWKKVIFNDVLYYNDSFKIEFETTEAERFKYEVDSTTKIIKYRDYNDEKADWNLMNYRKLSDDNYHFESVFKGDSISIKTSVKRLNDYNLLSQKKRWLIDLENEK